MTYEYDPTGDDVQFARDMVGIIADGGIWVWKATGMRYQFFHKVKVMELLNPELLADPEIALKHHKTIVTWSYIDWKVLPEEKS